VVEAAVMLEAGWEDAMDEVWVVAAEPEVAK
jgi:dephospho-CoA kinase